MDGVELGGIVVTVVGKGHVDSINFATVVGCSAEGFVDSLDFSVLLVKHCPCPAAGPGFGVADPSDSMKAVMSVSGTDAIDFPQGSFHERVFIIAELVGPLQGCCGKN